jgi:hypothetical protein
VSRSAWGGFLNAEQTGKINALFKRARSRRYGFTEHTYDFNGIIVLMRNFSVESSVRNIACIIFCLQLDTVFVNSVIVDITSFCLFANMISIKSLFCQERSTNFCHNALLILLFILMLSLHISLS